MEVSFGSIKIKEKDNTDSQHIVIPLDKVQYEPTIMFDKEKSKYYTLIMIDPDAPSKENPYNKYWLHWIKTNITDKNDGDLIVEFNPSAPPKNSGPHRYCIIVFEQKDKLNLQHYERPKFNLKQFVKDNDLKMVHCVIYVTENK